MNPRTAVLVSLAGLVAGCGGGVASAARDMTAAELANPVSMPDARLLDEHGDTFDLREGTAGKITFLFFGYTHCPDVCPLTMSALARGLGELDPAEREQVEAVFVTLDAARDDPARVEEWLGAIDPSFVGLTGEQEHLEEVLGQIGWKMPPIPPHEGPDYQVPHPATLYLFTPDQQGRFGYPAGEVEPDALARDVRRLEQVEW